MSDVHDSSSASYDAASSPDLLAEVLASVRLTACMLFLVETRPPFLSWAPRAEAIRRAALPRAQHLVSYHIVTQGRCWGSLRGGRPVTLAAGDVLVVPHGHAYFLADPPDAPASYGPAEARTFFRSMAAGTIPAVTREGRGDKPGAQFICGFLGCDAQPCNPVLAALPPLLHVRAGGMGAERMQHLVDFALSEVRRPSAGGRTVLLRLTELLFIEVVRRHLESLSTAHSGWLAGLKDPLVARTLGLLHAEPARSWTVESLAAQAGASRSALAERFARIVGEPPMQYLTRWRLQLAARLLDEPGAKVGAVASAVGYGSEAAFSRAFRQAAGMAPAAWRRRSTG